MLKKTVTYEDFNGETVTEDLFFHLSRAELVKLELRHQGGLSEALQRIIAAEDGKSIIEEFEHIILTAYGKRSSDGKRFIKNQELRDEFASSQAYDAFFMELILNTDSQVEFIQGITPAGFTDEVAKVVGADLKVVEEPEILPQPIQEDAVVYTRAQLNEMSQEELRQFGLDMVQGKATLAE